MNRKGLSNVVVIVLLIFLVIAAIAIIWAFSGPLVDRLFNQDASSFRVRFSINEAVAYESSSIVQLRVKREQGEGNVTAVNVVLEDEEGNKVPFRVDGRINEGEIVPLEVNYSGSDLGRLTMAYVVPVLWNSAGEREVDGRQVAEKVVIYADGEPITPGGIITSSERVDLKVSVLDEDLIVRSDVGGIYCNSSGGRTCLATYDEGTPVELTVEITGEGSVSWLGCDTFEGDVCQITMGDKKREVWVSLIPPGAEDYTLEVEVLSEFLSINSNPAGILGCTIDSGVCRFDYKDGTLVNLTSKITGGVSGVKVMWSGHECVGEGDKCDLIIDKDKKITVRLETIPSPDIYTLGVDVQVTGWRVDSDKPGHGGKFISCFTSAGDCSEDFDAGTVVTLTAIELTDPVEFYWEGCPKVFTGPTCEITLTTDTTVRLKKYGGLGTDPTGGLGTSTVGED